ncbi:hypothetical protein [Clostridium senegalense]
MDRDEFVIKNFGSFMADVFKNQNFNNIKSNHLHGYVEFMQDRGYSMSYAVIRFFYD